MQISPISSVLNSPTIQPVSYENNIQRTTAPKLQTDVFVSKPKEKVDLMSIKNEDGSRRFSIGEMLEIKKLEMKKLIDKPTVKYFADTTLDVKGMSEVYQYGKQVKDKNKEYEIIHEKIKDYEAPYSDVSPAERKKEGLNTKFTTKDIDGVKLYTLEDAKGKRKGDYYENGVTRCEMTISEDKGYYKKPVSFNNSDDNSQKENNDLDNKMKKYFLWSWLS